MDESYERKPSIAYSCWKDSFALINSIGPVEIEPDPAMTLFHNYLDNPKTIQS